nr:retrotransposon protein, putative, unclassified [Tanacetum cinerariifolium]
MVKGGEQVLKEFKGVQSTVDYDEPVMKKEESSKQGSKIAVIDADVKINLEKVQAGAYNLDLDHQEKVLSMLDVNDEEPASVEEVVDVFTATKLITEVVTTVGVDNMVGYKMNYFKGMSYNEIRPLFEKHYNYNQAFLNQVNKGIKVPEKEVRQEKEVKVESSKREGESLEQKIAKKQKMDQETEELKKRLQIVPDDDDDVYADATPLASKILIVDYKIHTKRNRPYFKIIRADGNHSTSSFNTASPYVNAISANFGITRKSSFMDPSKYPNDLDMPELEDIVYSDDEEDVDPQTRSMTRTVKEQGGLHQINDEDFHIYLPKGRRDIGLKWVFRNKKDKRGNVIKIKARLMDIKSAFLYRTIKEEVYVCQPPGFEDPDYPDKVYKVVKAHYGLHQAPRA